MFKEERTEPVFDWSMLGDVTEGRPNLGTLVSVEVYRLMQYTLRGQPNYPPNPTTCRTSPTLMRLSQVAPQGGAPSGGRDLQPERWRGEGEEFAHRPTMVRQPRGHRRGAPSPLPQPQRHMRTREVVVESPPLGVQQQHLWGLRQRPSAAGQCGDPLA